MLDPEILASIQAIPDSAIQGAQQPPQLDGGTLDAIKRTDEAVARRRDYLRDKYAWGLVAPLTGTRLTYSKKAIEEVTDPAERQWLVEEVGRIAQMQEAVQQDEYNTAPFLSRLTTNSQKVGGAFANASTGMTEAAAGLRDWLQGNGRSADDVRFLRAIESAKQAGNPFSGQAPGMSGKAATGAAGMAPDMAAGLVATTVGGPAGGFAYWTARNAAERREDYLELGLSPTASSLAGTATSATEGAIELLNLDPTGLTKPVAAPVKGMVRRGITQAAERIGGESLKSFVKHPVTRRAVGAGLETAKRIGLETLEEGLQGAVQEGGKYLAAKSSDQIEDRPAIDILKEGYSQAAEALPGLSVLGGAGGAVQAAEAAGRFKRFAKGTQEARIQAEIIEAANKADPPSREQWKKWGLPIEEGRSRQHRRDAVEQLANGYKSLDQIRMVLSGVTPTEQQWKQWGLPAEQGATPEQRRAFLLKRYTQQQAEAQQQQTDGNYERAVRDFYDTQGERLADEERRMYADFYARPDTALAWVMDNPQAADKLSKGGKYTNQAFKAADENLPEIDDANARRQWFGRVREALQLPEADRARLAEALKGDGGWKPLPEGEEAPPAFDSLKTPYGNYYRLRPKKGLKKAAAQTQTEEQVSPVQQQEQAKSEIQELPVAATERPAVETQAETSQALLPASESRVQRPAVASQQELQANAEEQQAATGFAPSQHDFPVEMEGTGERVSAREIVRQLEQIWGVPIRSGRIGSSRPRGIYKLRSMVSRLTKGEESSSAVAIHEAIGHHLDNTTDILKSAPTDAKSEVGTLDYDAKAARPSEGFAEFVRAYLTGGTERFKNGIDLKAVSPKFLAHFEQWVAQHADVKAKLEASRAPLEAYKRAGAVGRVKGQISKTGLDSEHPAPLAERVNELKEFLYTRIKEEGRPIKRFTDEAKERGYKPGSDTTPFEDYNALRQIGPHFAATAVEHGVLRLSGDMGKIGPSLREALVEIGDDADYENFVAWTYARHAIESWSHGKNPGITLDDAREAARRLYDPRYERAADKVTQFNNALLDVLTDVGVVDGETATRMKEMYKTYIPLERAKQGALGGGGRRMVDLSAAIKGRRGSGLQIIDPMEATLARAIRLYERAAQQVVINKLTKVAGDIKGLGGWVEEVPPKIMATNFSMEEIRPQIAKAIEDALGIDAGPLLDAVDPMTMLTVWRPDLMKVHGVPIVRVTMNGQPRFFQVHPELAEALGGLETLQHLDLATRTARAFTGMLKIGATRLNPDFILANAARDLQAFLMQGEKGLKGVFDPAVYAAAYVTTQLKHAAGEKGNPVVELFDKMGGELSTYAGLDRARLRKGINRLRDGKQGKLETAMSIAGVSEVAPRIAEFASLLERDGWLDRVKNGETPPMTVLIRAINAAHDVTIDFRRMGKWGRYLNYYLPFFNARLEGFDKFARTFKDNPSRATMRAGMTIVPLALLYWWSRHDDDDYKERPAWQDSFFVLKDSNGNPVWRVPKSQEWGLIESGVERLMDSMYNKDPEAMKRWFAQIVETANPVSTPAGITPYFESQFNYDSFRDRPIVSQNLQKLEGPDQYYDYTSKLAKGVARWLHDVSGKKISLSPAKIDHLANGLSGGLYGKINAPIDKLAEGTPLGMNDVPGLKGVTLRKGYAKSVDDFYAQKELLDKAHESSKLQAKGNAETEDLNLWRRMQSVSALMTDMREAARKLPHDDRIQVDRAMTGLARAALGREPLKDYPNPLASPSVVPPAVQAAISKHVAQKAIAASSNDKESASAFKYLHDMGVSPDVALDLAYVRLRSQGVKSDTANKRLARLGK